MSQQYTLFFEEIDKKDLPLVGGKGANLGELTKAGFPVPRGFCVTTGAYQAFLTHNLLVDFISQAIKDATLDNISSIGDKIRSRLRLSQIPQQVEQEIISAIDQAGSFNYYAVRSSATAEDLPFASFAGQQDTYLNIIG
ncbi:MAG TPA: phosphoenolpyruvate synthase, partial [Desulfosporosinus sp.]|nr:phosphoenolpyruvate synthase [Desulfosporosinus sp.]